MKEGHTVDELSRLIRPCIGLTNGDAQAAAKLYDSIIENLEKRAPTNEAENMQRKALDATCKYAEKKHRQRAMTIAEPEMHLHITEGQMKEYGSQQHRLSWNSKKEMEYIRR